MKAILLLLFMLFTYQVNLAQTMQKTPEQIAAEQRLKEIKKAYLASEYEVVLAFYDSLMTNKPFAQLETYKMGSESCLALAKLNANDSAVLISQSEMIYSEALKWHGKMVVEEKWDSLQITIEETPQDKVETESFPEFPGGMSAFYQYIGNEMRYPATARNNGVEGRVYVQFIVNKDGSIDAVNTVKGIGAGCDLEAERVIRNAPKFIPGMQRGEPVHVRMVLPIIFKLSNNSKKKKRRKSRN